MSSTVCSNYVIDPEKYLAPSLRISPFQTEDVFRNRQLLAGSNLLCYLRGRFPNYHAAITPSGRYAIGLALRCLKLSETDCVTIMTTSGNFYISSCVTNTIEQFCTWSRDIERNTKAILVNHEFGFPYERLSEIRNFGVPIIEDCAHAFLSQNFEQSVGTVGDFVVVSFPKYFPIQLGGALLSRQSELVSKCISVDCLMKQYITNVVGYYIPHARQWAEERRNNYQYLQRIFSRSGYEARFVLKDYHVPGVFMFKLPSGIPAQHVKDGLQGNGIEASVFYTENCVFVPVHHRLTSQAMDYFLAVVETKCQERR